MKRITHAPRAGWQAKVEGQGLLYHTPNGQPYWDETAHYEFTPAQIEELERATNELHGMCLKAAQKVIDEGRFKEFGIPDFAIRAIGHTWEAEPPSLYGRFDLAYNGDGPPKLLEYNADTPTSLLEASVVQWEWKEEFAPKSDQWNSIHERLVAKWEELRDHLPPVVHFTAIRDASHEDLMTITYLADTANAAGISTMGMDLEGMDQDEEGNFLDPRGNIIQAVFKLYPWEWLIHENPACLDGTTIWIEPAWKMLLSNKAILPVLWEMFPNHSNLLPAYDLKDALGTKAAPLAELGSSYVIKPKLSREGANVSITRNGITVSETTGDYGEEGNIAQGLANTYISGHHAVIGSWVIDGEAAGMGIRESDGPITDNLSRFVPHLIV